MIKSITFGGYGCTDWYVLHVQTSNVHQAPISSFRKAAEPPPSALPDNDDELTVSYNNNHPFVVHGGTELVCRLIDARFPDYKVVIPVDNPYKMVVNHRDFQNALRRVSVFSNKSTNQVALTISGSQLQLAAQDVDFSFEGNERMACQYDGKTCRSLSTPASSSRC